jgi:hypothetical protein
MLTTLTPGGVSSSAPIQILKDGASVIVTKDSSVPANTIPVPVEVVAASGTPINITAGDLNVQLTHAGANYDSTRIGDGTDLLAITAAGEAMVSVASLPLPTGAATEATLAAASAKLPAALGAQAIAGSMAVNIASNQVVPVSATALPLPTGASTEATLSALNAKVPAQGQAAMAASIPVVLASNQTAVPVSGPLTDTELRATAVPVSAASLPLPTGAATETTLSALNTKVPANLTVSSTRLLVDGSGVTQPVSGTFWQATQPVSGTFWQTTQPVSAASLPLPSGAATESSLLNVKAGRASVAHVRNVNSSVNITTAAYVQLVASLGAAVHEIEIFDSSGSSFVLATGAAASEADQVYVFPGGNGRIPLTIAASTRVSVKAVSANATTGEFLINFYGV